MTTIAESFDDHWIEQSGPLNTSCWIWQRACKGKEVINGGGYGCLRIEGKLIAAHKFSYERKYGPVPNDKQLMHECHNTKCVNPDHVTVGTNDENQMMKAMAGLSYSKLSIKDVQKIRRDYANGALQKDIAFEHDLHQGDVSNIVNRKYWQHVS